MYVPVSPVKAPDPVNILITASIWPCIHISVTASIFIYAPLLCPCPCLYACASIYLDAYTCSCTLGLQKKTSLQILLGPTYQAPKCFFLSLCLFLSLFLPLPFSSSPSFPSSFISSIYSKILFPSLATIGCLIAATYSAFCTYSPVATEQRLIKRLITCWN